MHDHPFRFLIAVVAIVGSAPSASAAGLDLPDLLTSDGRAVAVPLLGTEIRLLAEDGPLVTIEAMDAADAPQPAADPAVVQPVDAGQPAAVDAAPAAPVGPPADADAAPAEPVSADPTQGTGDGRAERNAADVARLMPWIGAIAGITVLAMLCAGIGSAWSRRNARAAKPTKPA